MATYKTLPTHSKKEVACAGKCSAETQHSVLAEVLERSGFRTLEFYEYHQIIQCDGCMTISFRRSHHTNEDRYQIGDDEYDIDESVTLFPARVANSRGLGEDVDYLPEPIALLYKETRDTLLNFSPVLTGIGLRALVESVCKEKNVNGDSLERKIDQLAIIGVLNASQLKILHLIRTLGNKAAHEVKPHSAEQLALAMDVVEHLLAGVYIMPRKVSFVFKEEELEAEVQAQKKKKQAEEKEKNSVQNLSKEVTPDYESRIENTINKRAWVALVEDLRSKGGGVVVTLQDGFVFDQTDDNKKTFESLKEAHLATIKKAIRQK